ncbi:MAG: hypothetical protein LBH14_00645, partial [Desulfobulbaceae bacterium]|nr:hypothetical protein [Desulfobulbaceae bacterium]
NILLSHFTFVCYDRDKPFDDKKAVISTGIEKPKLAAFATPVTAALETGRYAFTATSTQPYLPVKKSHYDIGSFYQNRPAMYELLKDALVSYENLPTIARSGKIHYVLSGHAHRAGAYTFTRLGYDFAAKAWLYKDPDKPEPSLDLRALGRDVVNARCLVCGAAGPYSYRNLKGELGGFGMARPQGMVLDVPGDRVEWKETGGQLPRLAVIMENLWYIGDCPPFEMIRVDPASKQFYFRLNKDFKKIFNGGHPFEAITLVGIWSADSSKGGEQKPIVNQFTMVPEQKETRVSETDGDGISYTLPTFLLNIKDDGEFTKYQDQLENNAKPFARFLSIKFTAVPGVVSGKEYNLTSPWCFPVNASGTMIARPSGTSGGEVPDWDYYGRTWKPEYEKKPAKKKAN